MPTRQNLLARGTERGDVIVRALIREAEAARIARGTSYAEIGRALVRASHRWAIHGYHPQIRR